ncbi:hypothetical protein HRI97_05945 [Treponema socranskii subsp. buccale]|uniref:hypothetical protein n=1 Tax=Treponema socranskii TaxID=53419 RepID=UPI0020A3FCE6|nr:hypothetical protein [Treponema socranskii]UTD02637.1 hypothetical protein HRI97_05945 [Treponema socranskii subsp. buccale]
MKSTVKKIVTAGLGAVLLSVICMLIACTDAPDSSEYEAEKIDGGVSLIVKRDRQVDRKRRANKHPFNPNRYEAYPQR